ncbi:MAG TPA: phosphopantetheine adenylyltransferase [Methanosarcinaceae archaeon]|nr:phosphopantetheine adenylyltransferase [Methanosarcinaceae archaeon]
MAKVAVGGTFEYLHDGHKALIKKAFEIAAGGEVYIGLTSNEMARQRSRDVDDYQIRKNNLLQYIEILGFSNKPYLVMKLTDPYGTTLTYDFDYIVVSPETYKVVLGVNELREQDGRSPIKIIIVEYVMADDEVPISSTRIACGEIDKHGNLKI